MNSKFSNITVDGIRYKWCVVKTTISDGRDYKLLIIDGRTKHFVDLSTLPDNEWYPYGRKLNLREVEFAIKHRLWEKQ